MLLCIRRHRDLRQRGGRVGIGEGRRGRHSGRYLRIGLDGEGYRRSETEEDRRGLHCECVEWMYENATRKVGAEGNNASKQGCGIPERAGLKRRKLVPGIIIHLFNDTNNSNGRIQVPQ